MKSFPAIGWFVHFVHRHDVEQADPRRPVYVLLGKDKHAGWLMPLSGDDFRVLGHPVELAGAALDEEWVKLESPEPWQPGKIPVVSQPEPLRVAFIDQVELERRRHQQAAQAIKAALAQGGESLLERVSLLEYADHLLGGNAVPLAALLTLAQEHEGAAAPELGDPARFRQRLLEAAPAGLESLQRQLNVPGYEPLSKDKQLRRRLVLAAFDAFSTSDALAPGQWQPLRSRLLWSWWLHARLSVQKQPLRQLAHELGTPAAALSSWLRAEADTPSPPGNLPPEESVRVELERLMSTPPVDMLAVATIAAVHRPRWQVLASQVAALERMLGQTERLRKWERCRPLLPRLAEVAFRLERPTWFRAERAAERARQEWLGTSRESPLKLSQLLEATCAHVLLGAMPFDGLAGEWAVGEGGAPVVCFSPALLQGEPGVLRFTLAHQMGHLLESSVGGTTACTWLADEEQTRGAAEAESFANAFALYLLAPRNAVLELVGEPDSSAPSPQWLQEAASNVATTFGISMGAAVRHVLNCLKVAPADFDRALSALHEHLSEEDWRHARNSVGECWGVDRKYVEEQAGEPPVQSLAGALQRPRSLAFDKLVAEAAARGLLSHEQQQELAA
jgi:hypothetical protein